MKIKYIHLETPIEIDLTLNTHWNAVLRLFMKINIASVSGKERASFGNTGLLFWKQHFWAVKKMSNFNSGETTYVKQRVWEGQKRNVSNTTESLQDFNTSSHWSKLSIKNLGKMKISSFPKIF